MKGKRLLVAVACAGLLAVVALFAFSESLYEVVDKGRGDAIVPYDAGLVYKVRVLDLFTVYASEETRPDTDKLSSVGLVVSATMCLMTLLLLTAARASPQLRRFYGFATVGLAVLAADELFGVHETLGHNLQFLADLPGVEHPDDLLFALYVVPLAIFAWSFRRIVLGYPGATRAFAAGGLLFGVAIVADVTGTRFDETAEPLAAVCLLVGLVMITVAVLRRELALDAIAAARLPRPPAPAPERRSAPPTSVA